MQTHVTDEAAPCRLSRFTPRERIPTRLRDPALSHSWPSVGDAGPAMRQHWFTPCCLLSCSIATTAASFSSLLNLCKDNILISRASLIVACDMTGSSRVILKFAEKLESKIRYKSKRKRLSDENDQCKFSLEIEGTSHAF